MMFRHFKLRGVRLLLAAVVALTSVNFIHLATASSGEYTSAGSWPGVTWHLKAPRGMASDGSGNVFVADTGNNRVVKYDAAGRYVTSWGGLGTDNGKFNQPWDVAVDPSGQNVFVSDTKNHRVQQFLVDGQTAKFVRRWGKAGGPDYAGSGNGEFNEPHGIAMDASGNVYVVDTKNYRVQKFSTNGTYVTQWGTPGSDVDKFLEPIAIDVAPDGWVYVLDAHETNCYIRAFEPDGTPAEFQHGGNGWGAYSYSWLQGHFQRPLGIAVDDDGYVYVSDSYPANRIQKFTFDGEFLSKWGQSGYGDVTPDDTDLFMDASGLDASGSGMDVRVLVADGATKWGKSSSSGDRIREFNGEGYPLRGLDPRGVLGSHGDAYGRQDEPWDVAIGEGGTVYVTDRFNHRVQRFSSTGDFDNVVTPERIPTSPRIDNGYFTEPTAVAYDPVSQFVFVAEAGDAKPESHRIQRLTADLAYEGEKWGAFGTAPGSFNKPQGIAVGPARPGSTDPHGRWVYVSDTGNNRIQLFDILGNHRATITGLNQPGGIVVDANGVIYCADSGNRRVVKLTPNASWTSWVLVPIINPGPGEAALARPWGLALDGEGSLYVTDVDAHKVKKYNASTGAFITTWSSRGSAQGLLDTPRGLDVNANGVVYVADSVNDRFQAFVKPIEMSITGVTDGGVYKTSVTPSVNWGPGAVAWGAELDGFDWSQGTSVGDEGAHVLRAWAEDSHGFVHEKIVQFTIDLTPPTTSAPAQATYSNRAVVNLTALDALSGVGKVCWSLDGGSTVTGTSVTVTRAGTHNLFYWAEDKAGNQETPKPLTFEVVDTWAPTTTCNVKTTYVAKADIALIASDSGTAVKATYYQLDGGAPVKANSLTVTAVGSHSLQYWSEDTAGNIEPKRSASFIVKQATAIVASRTDGKVPYKGTSTVKATLKTFSGSVLKGKSLKLYRSYDGKSWSHMTTIWSSTGYYRYDVTLKKKTYFKWAYDGSDTYVGSAGQTSVNAKAYLTKPSAPSTAYRKKSTYMSGYLKTRHPSGTRVVTLRAYRYENGRWVRRATGYATAKNYSSYSRYTGKVVFPYRGKWKVRAYHNDADHLATKSRFDYVTVK